jgi:hypothetical protein
MTTEAGVAWLPNAARDSPEMSQSINAIRDGQKMSDSVASILHRFPGPVTLHSSRRKWGLMLLGGVGIIGLAVFLLQHDQTLYDQIIFWSAIPFGAFGILVSIKTLLPGSSKLTLDSRGFEITKFFRSRRISWADASGFQIFSNPYLRYGVGVVFDNGKQTHSIVTSMNVSLAGRNAYFPDTYGLAADDLVRLMNQWRELALK